MNTIALIVMIVITWISAYASLFLKKGSLKFSRNNLLGIINMNITIGIFLYLIGTISYLLLLKGNELSTIYPLSALTYIWVLFISSYHLSEELNKFKILGMSLIIFGVLFIVL